jgi:hypothetical protein
MYQGSRRNRILRPGRSPLFAGGLVFPFEADFEDGTIGQAVTTGTPWVGSANGNQVDIPLVQAQPVTYFAKFGAYSQCAEFNPLADAEGCAVDFGATLPKDWRLECGVFLADTEEYCFPTISDVNDLYANIGDMVRTNIKGDDNTLNNLSFVDGATVDNDSESESPQTFDRPTKIRFEYTDSTRLMNVDVIKYGGLTWNNSTTISGSVDLSTLRWFTYFGGANTAFWGTHHLVYLWVGNKTDPWPTRTIQVI